MRLARAFLLLSVLSGAAHAQGDAALEYFSQAEKDILAKDYVGARAKILAGLALEPDHANAMVNLANVYILEKNWAEATTWFDKALAIDPKNAIGWNGRGLAYLNTGNLPKAVESFLRAAKADPSNPTPLDNLGDVAMITGDRAAALEYYSLAVQMKADDVHANTQLAELYAEKRDGKNALSHAGAAMRVAPRDPRVLAAAGRAFVANGEPFKGIGFLVDAARGRPDDASIHYSLGVALLETRQYQPASDAFLNALDIDDKDPRVHLQLGVTYYLSKEPELVRYAQEELRHVLERNPLPADRASAQYHLALIEDDAGRLDAAIALYGEALRTKPDHAPSLNNVGLIHSRRARYNEAIGWFRKALKAEPDFAAARLNLGHALLKIGRPAEARVELQKVELSSKLAPDDPLKRQAKELLQSRSN